MRFQSYGAAGVLTVCLLSAPALAYSNGITGYSGNSAETCNKCHYTVPPGGPAPTVEITGPTSLTAGSKGEYTLIIRGGPAVKGGMNVAVDNTAAALEAGAGLKREKNELTHSDTPKAFSGGEVRFDFSMVAPPDAGTVKIFGAGNSVNGDGDLGGDLSATTTLSVTITGNDTEEEPGGCSSTGGAPMLLFSLLAGSMTLLRRRRS